MHSVPPMISPRTENQGVDALSRECTVGLRLGEGSLSLLALNAACHPLRCLDHRFSPSSFFLKAQKP